LTSATAVRETGADYIGSVHNNYLEVLVDSGLIGLAVFFCWLVVALRALTRQERRLRLGLLPWGLGLAVAALFGDFLIAAPQNNGFATVHLSGLFWLLTGMAASAGEAAK
jgi:O-antigen ligase